MLNFNRMQFTPGPKPVATIMNDIENLERGGLDLQPIYQRDFIWNKDFKDKLIFSIIQNYPIGAIMVRERGNQKNEKGALQEVVDGQQRLRTIYNFVKDNYSISGNMAIKILKYIKMYLGNKSNNEKIFNKLENKSGINFKFKDLPDIIKNNIQSYLLSITSISYADEEQITEYFNFVQNQEILRAGEIINSIPDTTLRQYLLKLKNFDILLELLGFSNKRKEFEKIFYNIIGIFDKKLSLGTTDNQIIKYVSNTKNNIDITVEFYINNIVNNINYISMCNNSKKFKTNKRFVKLLLLLCGFDKLNFANDSLNILNRLEKINTVLRIFSSTKTKSLKEEFIGFNNAEIENYKFIESVTKGEHKYNELFEACEILANNIKTDEKIIKLGKNWTAEI